MSDDEAPLRPAGGMSARELEKMIQRELADGAPRPSTTPRKDRPLKPDLQRDLDALLGSILADLEPGLREK